MVLSNVGMNSLNRTKTTPIPINRTNRTQNLRVLTSMPAGKMVPIAAFPLLREDALAMSRFRLNFSMMETEEILVNAVNINVKAYLVPYLAFERFNGIDQLNRSYQKVKEQVDDVAPVPFFTTVAFNHVNMPILTAMGLHARTGQLINTAYIEAYNTIWNFRAANRSPDITKRALTDGSYAKAFWQHSQFAHIVPDFDQAIIDGEVPLTVTDPAIALRGLNGTGGYNAQRGVANFFRQSNAANLAYIQNATANNSAVTTTNNVPAVPDMLKPFVDLTQIVGELAENGVTVSLSNIELARKAQGFAALRKQYTGLSDDYIIDLLMNGIELPEQMWSQPILLADRTTVYGMSKRYSSSADDLTASVVNGQSFLDLAITCPRCNTGGIVMIVAEITPEQLFERQADPLLLLSDQEKLPEFLRDTLDPEKVEIVQNQQIDIDHDTPTATFGYAPLNWQWNSRAPGIGGKFYRNHVDDPFDEDRNRIWAVETKNPTLSEDFYLCTNMNLKPFVDQVSDPFEVWMRGVASISGNTVFGHLLVEASDDYNQIMEEAPLDRIDKPVTLEEEATGDANFDAAGDAE